jgi:hypothetical protein
VRGVHLAARERNNRWRDAAHVSYFTKQLFAFTESRGCVIPDQLISGDADLFYGSLKLGWRAMAKRLGKLGAFFRFCVNRELLPESPVSGGLRHRSGRAV